jgi:hypothetical protein
MEPSERLKEQLDKTIIDMIHNYNQLNYEINSQQLCASNDKYDAQLMNQHYTKVNELYERERQKLKNYYIISSRNYTDIQSMEITTMENYLEDKLRGNPIGKDYERMFEESVKGNPILYEEALLRTEIKRDYFFLEKAVRYYRISVLLSGGRMESLL